MTTERGNEEYPFDADKTIEYLLDLADRVDETPISQLLDPEEVSEPQETLRSVLAEFETLEKRYAEIRDQNVEMQDCLVRLEEKIDALETEQRTPPSQSSASELLLELDALWSATPRTWGNARSQTDAIWITDGTEVVPYGKWRIGKKLADFGEVDTKLHRWSLQRALKKAFRAENELLPPKGSSESKVQ